MTRRATANVLNTLSDSRVRDRLADLTERADVIALQEWGHGRNHLLRETGTVAIGPWLRKPKQRGPFTWARGRVGGGPIGVRNSLGWDLLSARAKMLVGPGRMDPAPGRRTWLGPSWATVTRWRRPDGRVVVLINVHLTAGVQQGKDRYRSDRPARVARHKAERRALERLLTKHRAKGRIVEVYGDSNYHWMSVPGLTPWWVETGGGTLGARAIDGIWTGTRPTTVRFLPALARGEHRHVITTTKET